MAKDSKRRFDNIFPLSYKEGFNQWWTGLPAAQAEHKVLSFIPFLKPAQNQADTDAASPAAPRSCITSSDKQSTAIPSTHLSWTTSTDDPHGPRQVHSRQIQLPGKDRSLNEFSVERTGETKDQNLVILHGYGAGLGLFYKNFEPLSRVKGWQLYALDLLGMGRSSRPPFRIKAKERAAQITEAEDWFVDSLEEWRVAKKIDRFTLLGHSLGGYMAVAYALKYPGRLNKLILASPVGIPEDPYAVNAAMPEPEASTLANEFTQDQDSETVAKTNASSTKNSNSSRSANGPPVRRPLGKWLTYLWDANVSPFSFVRWSGPLGPRIVSGWTSRRFSHLPADEAQALHEYAYSLFCLRGSGEYALAYILAPGAFARSPLIRRIHGVGRQVLPPSGTPLDSSNISNVLDTSDTTKNPSNVSGALCSNQRTSLSPQHKPAPQTLDSTVLSSSSSSSLSSSPSSSTPRRESGIPIVLMYGENDWMDVAGGYAAKEIIDREQQRWRKLQQSTLSSSSSMTKDKGKDSKSKGNQVASAKINDDDGDDDDDNNGVEDTGSAKVIVIPRAGHHLYLDSSDKFNQAVIEEMEDVQRRRRRR